MNRVELVGRLTRDCEIKFTPGEGRAVTTFTIAVDRPHTKDKTDFISCVGWNKQAEFIGNYGTKGRLCEVSGYITTRSWDRQDGTKGYATEVSVEEFKFLDKKPGAAAGEPHTEEFGGFDATEMDGDIPF